MEKNKKIVIKELKNEMNEAIENGDFEKVDQLAEKIYELENIEYELACPAKFADEVIASSKGRVKFMNKKMKKLVVAASCTILIGVAGISVNALSGGETLNQVKVWFEKVGGENVKKKQYKDNDGNDCVEYDIDKFNVKEIKGKDETNIIINDKDNEDK